MAKLPFDIPQGLSFNNIEEANAYFQKQVDKSNNQARPEFDGLSPHQMQKLIRIGPDANSGLVSGDLQEEDLLRIPLFQTVRYYLACLEREGELKLTPQGNLPVKLIREIYDQGYFDEWECNRIKQIKESDSLMIRLTRILVQISGLSKTRNNKLSLTKQGLIIMKDTSMLYQSILYNWMYRFNWAYLDYHKSEVIAKECFPFSLYLLQKYGDEFRPTDFYAQKYFEAFPQLKMPEEVRIYGVTNFSHSCYAVRTFDRFLLLLNAVEISQQKWSEPVLVRKTDLFDKLFKIIY
jgi:hypothetical protein